MMISLSLDLRMIAELKQYWKHIILYGVLYLLIALMYILKVSKGIDKQLDLMKFDPTIESLSSSSLKIEENPNFAAMHLFGISQASIKEATNSNIKLTGIMYSDKGSKVIVNINDKDFELIKGSKIYSTYVINEIEKDKIIVQTENGLEVFELFNR